MSEPYELIVAAPAARAIAEELPESVAHAVIDLITGPLLNDPHRLGRELRRELQGCSPLVEGPIDCCTASTTPVTRSP